MPKHFLPASLIFLLLAVAGCGPVASPKATAPKAVPEPATQAERPPAPPALSATEVLKQQNDEMVKHLTLESSRAENRRIKGTVVNNGKKTGYVFVHFNVYDETGTKTNTKSAHIQSLDAGERWNFETSASDFASFKFSHFTAQPPR